jgi:hypothetical protein
MSNGKIIVAQHDPLQIPLFDDVIYDVIVCVAIVPCTSSLAVLEQITTGRSGCAAALAVLLQAVVRVRT